MAQISLPTTVETPVQAVAEKVARLHFVDHLRAALVILVVLHHLAVIYGAGAPFYYVEPRLDNPGALLMLLVFVLFNQAWFMGALFLIAGYFTPGSFERKGSRAFLKSRLVRLGIPLVLFTLVLGPLSATGYWQMPASLTGITTPLTLATYPFLIGMGPLWFVALLLVFSFGYALWRNLTANRAAAPQRTASRPGYLGIVAFIIGLGIANYLIRIIIPMGREVLDFPTLAYLPQYLSFFVLGTVAVRRDWFRTVPGSMGVIGFLAALVATVFLFPLALSGTLFSLDVAEQAAFTGFGTWESAAYALWDATFAVGMFLAALTLFRRFFAGASRFGKFLSDQSYAVYIIHSPIIVFAAVALKELDLSTLPKFAVVALITVPICFIVAYILRKIPGVARVL